MDSIGCQTRNAYVHHFTEKVDPESPSASLPLMEVSEGRSIHYGELPTTLHCQCVLVVEGSS